jgi:predicted amidohydrolase YtcJ
LTVPWNSNSAMQKNLRRVLTTIALVTVFPGCNEPQSPGSDRVFIGGAVYTADESRSWAEAVAITDGEIVFVGSNEAAEAFIGTNTDVIELDGKILLPGFHDGHPHVRYGGTAAWGCSLQNEQDVAKIRSALVECASSREYGTDEWVLGGGWPLSAFPDGNPSGAMLDEIFGDRPAFFNDAFGHNAWVSSRALQMAGIDSNTPDPPQGVIVRDPVTGRPTGTLRDSAMILVETLIPEATEEERYGGLLTGLEEANKLGITAYIEPGIGEGNLSLFAKAERRGELTARVLASLSPIDELPDRFGAEIFDLLAKRDQFRGTYIDVDSVKVYIDGVIETRTSTMLEPYLDGSNFPPFYEQDELNVLYEKLDAMGVQIHTHAIGDGAIRIALDAYEHAFYANGANDNRHQIVHLQLIDEKDIPRFAELNVAANFQCLWCYPDVYIDLAVDLVGEERVQAFYPVRSIKDSGGLLVGGSDWDVTSLNPLDAIETAVRRQDPFEESGRVLGQNEEIDLVTALDMYTRNAAYIMRLEDKTGSIEVGKRADLIVLDRNLFEIPLTEINEAKVLLTMMDGKTVYSANGMK